MPRKPIEPSESEDSYDDTTVEASDDESMVKRIKKVKDKVLAKRYPLKNIKNIIFEEIDEEFSLGKMGPFDVLIMNKNGYVNATKLCNGAGKEFRDWYRLASAKEFIKVLGSSVLKCADELIIRPSGLGNKLKGSYVHPKLIIVIAQWCSPEYAMMVTDIMTEYHSKEAIKEKDEIIGKKDDKIDELMKQIDKQSKEFRQRFDKMQKADKKQLNIIVDMHKTTKQQLRKIDNLQDTCEEMKDNMLIISNDRVIRGEPKYDNQLFILENNGNPKDVAEGETYYEYTAIRTAKQSMPYRIKDHKLSFPKAKSLLEIDTPNAINLWQRYLRKNNGNVESHYSDFNVCKIYSIEQMLRDLESIHDERLDVNR